MTRYYLIPSDELYHHGVLGMRWGHRKVRVSKGHRKGRVSKGNRYRENNRRTSFIQTEKSLKKKIESDKREADNRVKFYGGKAAATAAIQNEASHRKAVKGAKGYTAAVLSTVAGITVGVLTAGTPPTAGVVGATFGGPIVGAGIAAATAMGIRHIKEHANEQIGYTRDSKAAPDYRVAYK